MFLEFTDATSRNTSGGIKIGIHGIKIGKFRLDLPGWAGIFSDLISKGEVPGDAALAATADAIRQNPSALNAALFGEGHDPNKFWDIFAALMQDGNGSTPAGLESAEAANTAVMQAQDASRTSTGPLLLIGGALVLLTLMGGLKRFFGGGSGGRRRRRGRRRGRGRRSFSRRGRGRKVRRFGRRRFR